MSLSHDRALSARERPSLRVHLCICGMCRRAAKQLHFVESLGRAQTGRAEDGESHTALPTEARERLKRELARAPDEGAGSDPR